MKSNAELQKAVQDAIAWEPMLNGAKIGVAVTDGVVTLTGAVDNFSMKTEAEDAVKKVAGVIVVVENIELRIAASGRRSDNEIAAQVVNVLKWNWDIPDDKVKAIVKDGWITLEGEVSWDYERVTVQDAVSMLPGVKGVSNNIKLKPESGNAIEAGQIRSAFNRHWSLAASDITVKVSVKKATLSGTVDSPYQKDEADQLAWKTPGILSVENDLIVESDYLLKDKE